MEISIDRKIEILELVKDNLADNEHIDSICHSLTVLVINNLVTVEEQTEILVLLQKNKPDTDNQYKEFAVKPLWKGDIHNFPTFGYWWVKTGLEPLTRKIRTDYLKKLISNLK